MTEQEFKKSMKAGSVKIVERPAPEKKPEVRSPLDEFTPYLEALRYNKRALTSAPTKTPAGILNHFEFYDDGVDRRLYLYVNGTWRYVALT